MAAGAFELDLAAPFGVALRSGVGPILLDRRFYTATGADTFPKGAGRAVFYGTGGGGWCRGQSYDGGGAAWAKRTVPCTPGGAFNIEIGRGGVAPSYNQGRENDGQHTLVTIAGVIVLKAVGGNSGLRYLYDAGSESYYEVPDGKPGGAADCIGDVRISGSGRLVGNGTLGDRLFIPSAQTPQANGTVGAASFPGGGGQSTSVASASFIGGPGLVIAELWSA